MANITSYISHYIPLRNNSRFLEEIGIEAIIALEKIVNKHCYLLGLRQFFFELDEYVILPGFPECSHGNISLMNEIAFPIKSPLCNQDMDMRLITKAQEINLTPLF